MRLCGGQRITISGDSLSFVRSLLASRLAGLLKLWARYSAENTNLAPEGEPVVACCPIKSHRCTPHTVTAVICARLSDFIPAFGDIHRNPSRFVLAEQLDGLSLQSPLGPNDQIV